LHARIVKNDQTSFEKITYSEFIHVTSLNKFFFAVLEPSNINAKLKISKMPSEQDYTRPVLDVKIDLKQINLNINRDQVG
jgi:GH25 family lysozyme M1 (1,4-beta-N-acetylmuramidase)